LKEIGVYNNTRIILASDHGGIVDTIKELKFNGKILEGIAPLLMVKDFNSSGFKISSEFMTNADVATLATQNLEFDAVNPFTGKDINMNEKYAHPQYISASGDWDIKTNNKYNFSASDWLCFDSTEQNCNIYNMENWSYQGKSIVLKKHAFN
jgi:hypothetical protein